MIVFKRSFMALALLGSALASLPAAATVNTSPAIGQINEGARQLNSGRIEKGMKMTRDAIKSNSLDYINLGVAYNNLCVGHSAQGDFSAAIETCDRAIEINRRDWRFHNNRGTAAFGTGDLAAAITALRTQIDNPVGCLYQHARWGVWQR